VRHRTDVSRFDSRSAGEDRSVERPAPFQPKVFALQTVPARGVEPRPGVAQYAGFSLHAGIGVEADQRAKLERLARYVSRPPVSIERLALTDALSGAFAAQAARHSASPERRFIRSIRPRPQATITPCRTALT